MKRTLQYLSPAIPLAAVATLAGSVLLVDSGPAQSQAVQVVEVDVKLLGQGYRASKLIGHDVYNAADEDIGEIEDLIIDGNKVLFAVLEVGGFLGLGGRLIAVPTESFVIEQAGSKLKIKMPGGSREALEKSKEFKYQEGSQKSE
jgi:hypothetical protein